MNKQELIDRLNEDLAGELGAIIQYLTYAAKVTGPYRPQLQSFFMAEVPDEQRHAKLLADKIVALGGEPTTIPRPVKEANTNRQMVEAVLESEHRTIKDYTRRIKEADDYGEKGLAIQLEDILSDESKHAEETELLLRNWPM